MSGIPAFFRPAAGGVEITVRVTPKSARDAIEGVGEADGRVFLKVRVRAVPESGKANQAVEKLLAAELDVPVRDVRVASGGSARLKKLFVSGDSQLLSERLKALILKIL